MKQKLSFTFLICILFLFVLGCEYNDDKVGSNEKVELYLIDSYIKMGNSCHIDENSVVPKDSALINYSDFLSYDSAEYAFEITSEAKYRIMNLEHSVYGVAFAMKANDSIIYTGYFWPITSSVSCNWTVISPIFISENNIKVSLGYPGGSSHTIPDRRNDKEIIRIFKMDNKLK